MAARVAASLVTAAGFPELVTASEGEYKDLAVALAEDPPRLRALQQRLADARDSSPFFDTPQWMRDWEDLALAMADEPYLPPRIDPATGELERFIEV